MAKESRSIGSYPIQWIFTLWIWPKLNPPCCISGLGLIHSSPMDFGFRWIPISSYCLFSLNRPNSTQNAPIIQSLYSSKMMIFWIPKSDSSKIESSCINLNDKKPNLLECIYILRGLTKGAFLFISTIRSQFFFNWIFHLSLGLREHKKYSNKLKFWLKNKHGG